MSNQDEQCDTREMTVEEWCGSVRSKVTPLEQELCYIIERVNRQESAGQLDGPNVPKDSRSNQLANLTLAFRHLEDARMRLGKVMQAIQGGVSILDK